MRSECKSILLATIISIFIYQYCLSESSDFRFDANNLNNDQRDRLFTHLDTNNDNNLTKAEFEKLFPILFYSTKLNKSYEISDENVCKMFDLLDFNSDKHIERVEFNYIWNHWIKTILKPKSALIVVDVQNDFIADNGSMPVPDGKTIIPFIDQLIQTVEFETVFYTIDWHPSNHCSFVESVHNSSIHRNVIKMDKKSVNDLKSGDSVVFEKYPNITQVLWPQHCVQNTWGAQLYSGLTQINNSVSIHKGMDPDIDSYSAFWDNDMLHNTTLDYELKRRGITDVYMSGVVYEFCVGETAKHALSLDYRTAFVENSIHGLNKEKRDKMRCDLIERSANLIQAGEVSDMVAGSDRRWEMGLVLARKVAKMFENQ